MSEKLMAIIAITLLIGVCSIAVYTETGNKNEEIIIDLKDKVDPFESIPKILPSENITSIREVNKYTNEYRVVIKTKKERKSLLKWILGNKNVEDAR